MAELQLQGLRRTYANGVTAVDGIDLTVRDGEFMVLVGPSGCGKSTTLRMIAGLEDISAGHLRIGGEDMTHVAPADRGVAMVFQSYALYPHMTVAENMGFALRIAGRPKAEIEASVRKAADALQLAHLLDRKPRALSGGQRQRVAIGRAIVRSPKVFLFDEPLSNLDASLRTQMRLEMARLHEQLGVSVVYVTHDQVEAMTLGDRIAVFNSGRIEQVGTPSEVYRQPVNQFVAGFLGAPRMNFLPARAFRGTAGPGLEIAGAGRLALPEGCDAALAAVQV
ncbi:MAG TPA: ATP-binding cassette domain-containing protein, partial [Burkholderiaceae bacterium]